MLDRRQAFLLDMVGAVAMTGAAVALSGADSCGHWKACWRACSAWTQVTSARTRRSSPAARLEALNRDYGTRILISESTRRLAGGGFAFTALGEVTARGTSEPVPVYTVTA